MRVSIDALEVRNDALRGAGNFAAAMRALEIYYSVGFKPKVLMRVTSQSLPDLEELICLLIEKKFTRINLNGFRPIGRGRTHWELMVNTDDVRETLKRVQSSNFQAPSSEDENPQSAVELRCRFFPEHHAERRCFSVSYFD